MKKIRLGKSELMVSQVGFGGIPITRVSQQEAEKCIHRCLEHGINYIDTATGYGDSEEKIGKAIKGRRDGLVIASKAPPTDARFMAESIDKSLKRMQIETIDLYQFHCIKDRQGLQKCIELMPVMEKAKSQGKIRHIGITIHGVDIIKPIVETGLFETAMIALNFIVREPLESAVPAAVKHDVGIIAMKPMAGGHIADASLAFKFFNGMDNVVPLVGIEKPEEIDQIAATIEEDEKPDERELAKMDRIRSESGDQFCRRCEYCMPCPHGVQIFPITIYESLVKRLPVEKVTDESWKKMMKTVENCTDCGRCEQKCPYDLKIREILAHSAGLYENLISK
ncbi:General stress protein 69 [Limihaloglobus sulfuriphilus]|uniref:General stress protein 69 n=1 Tax=Limihaloglobus sulfuriphilus TaxID=1851148 RepID=A0A1Q2MAP2_9BACT|nr:aldo/keto reductase [Limihaloglobus sulfuriphilus]AQQ69793.1 General stress protein 69 [Limihaloglobus sulfuriphilus]